MNSPRARHATTVALVVALTAALYVGVLNAPFVFDDFPNIVKNPHVQRFAGSFDDWIDVAFKSPSKRPIANLSFALNRYFGGDQVVGYHVVNIAIHAINGILVYALAWVLFSASPSNANRHSEPRTALSSAQARMAARFAAAVFICHPIQVQSVTYIVQRMNSLATLFYLAGLLLFIAGRSAPRFGPRWGRWSACALCWLLAVGSKQTAITLPAVLLLYEWYFVQDLSRSWFVRNIGYFAAAAALSLVLVVSNTDLLNLAGYADRDFTMGERLLTQLRVVVFYFSLVLLPFPSRLTLSHSFTTSHSWIDPPATLLSLLVIVAALGAAVWMAKRWRLASFCIIWFFLHLLLESSLLPLEMVFEHRLYLPMIGIDLIGCYLLFRALGDRQVRWLPGATPIAAPIAIAIVFALGGATLARNATWSEPVSLWSDVIAKNPADHRAQFNLGVALSDQHRYSESIQRHTEAIRLHPDNAKALNGLGVALAGKGQYAEAVEQFAASLRIDPADRETQGNIALALSRMRTQSAPARHR